MKRAGGLRNAGLGALILGALLLVAAKPAPKKLPPLEASLKAHVEILASDEFQGREPGTEGETKTLRYLARQWFDIGMEAGTNIPGNGWFAPVDLVEREPVISRASFLRGRKLLPLAEDSVFVVTSGLRSLVQNAPLLFVGHATFPSMPRAELAGRIAVMLDSVPAGTDPQKVGDRAGGLLDAGALAVVTVLDGERGLEDVIARRNRAGYTIAGERISDEIEAFMSATTADMLLAGSAHGKVAKLRTDAASARFAPYVLGIDATFEATSRETRIRTHNLIGRIPGRNPNAGAVLMMAHWDHFGHCAQAPAEDLICNGAIDNASGLAVVTEAARILAKGRQMDRDVYIVATTGEELGLLGAFAFAENPPIPLDRIVAVFNVDSTGLVPKGSPVGIVGKGLTPLDPLIAEVVRKTKRKLAPGDGPNAYIKRQDSWALMQHDVPAVMVSSSYGDMERIERFMEDTYHRPLDQAGGSINYSGMADDVSLQVELVRAFSDAKRYPARGKVSHQTP
ncbi:peptidase M28 [Novosphingobium sp. AAP83]|uniref:M28 family metallopeptidase n=1 Tax=Novosphingobium sp. AAP83 TaxID=1523425 RepID=UPI0006B8D854|nr:M28 family peptidase [Novosphingobium sp. AAP83]KPF90945.1 peptidase M28 [Novosphingobium sp. AAP83]